MRCLAGVTFAVVFAASVSPATADYVQTGILECRGISQQYVITSLTNLQCVFRSHTGASHGYVASIRRVGLDIGVNQSTVLAWAVYAPTRTGRATSAASTSADPPTQRSASAPVSTHCSAVRTTRSRCSPSAFRARQALARPAAFRRCSCSRLTGFGVTAAKASVGPTVSIFDITTLTYADHLGGTIN